MAKKRGKITGTERAAQFLMVMGEERAAEILRRLSTEEVQKIGLQMTRMGELSTEEVNNVLQSFLEGCHANQSINIVADEFTRNVLIQALGQDAAERLLEKIMLGGNTKGLDSLRWMEPELIAGIIRNEHPQIQSIILSYIPAEQAGEVLEHLPENAAPELVIRMSEMEAVDPKALQELNRALERQVEGVASKESSAIGGVKNVANIFNTLDNAFQESLMEKVMEQQPEIATRIQDLMFIFEDIKNIPNKDFQLVLREISTDKLALALKGADQSLVDKVTGNMSSRASEIFKDDMENMGPVKVSDVEAAQKEILAVVKNLADAGQIILSEESQEMIG